MANFFETYLTLPSWLALTVAAVIHCLLLLHLFALVPLFFIWLERKVAGRIQDRLGPTRVGGQFGWLQTLADGIKLILKEDLAPLAADKPLFRMAPYIVFLGSFVAFLALPFASGSTTEGTFATWVAKELDIAVFFILAVMSLEVFGIILAGYASGSKWSLFGGMREAAQMVSYEVPMAICVVIPVLVAGTMNLSLIGHMQKGWFWNWFLFHDPFTFLSFWVYCTCALASVKRAPFDLAEAESELVAGFHTEYSGLRWSFFFMAEYSSMFAVSGIAAILFLGGWNGPVPITSFLGIDEIYAGRFIGMLNFIGKAFLLVFIMIWIRWTLPRLRIDQVMKTCLKYLLPMSCALLLATAVWPLVFPSGLLYAVLGESSPIVNPLGEVYPKKQTQQSEPEDSREQAGVSAEQAALGVASKYSRSVATKRSGNPEPEYKAYEVSQAQPPATLRTAAATREVTP